MAGLEVLISVLGVLRLQSLIEAMTLLPDSEYGRLLHDVLRIQQEQPPSGT